MLSTHKFSVYRANMLTLNMSPKTRWLAALLFPLVVGPVWCLAWHGYGGRLGTLSGLVLLGALITSAITDFNRQRIYNWTTYSAFLWALIINVAASAATYGTEPLAPSFEPAQVIGNSLLGGIGIGECLVGAGACFMITMFGYDLSGGGAGDVKLATVIGALLGLHDGAFAVACSYIVAALAIIVWSTWKNGPMALIKAGVRKLGRVLGPLWPFPSTSEDQSLLMTPVPLGPYFAIGTLLVVLGLIPS
jgi:Flp pilus assembly protein protease CpaA